MSNRVYMGKAGLYPKQKAVSMTEQQHKMISLYCKNSNTSFSELMRGMIEEYLKLEHTNEYTKSSS